MSMVLGESQSHLNGHRAADGSALRQILRSPLRVTQSLLQCLSITLSYARDARVRARTMALCPQEGGDDVPAPPAVLEARHENARSNHQAPTVARIAEGSRQHGRPHVGEAGTVDGEAG